MKPDPFDANRTPLWHSAPATEGELEELAPGSGMARYRLERVLGEGTYGRVHLARQDVLGRKVAVKILHRRHGSTKDEMTPQTLEVISELTHDFLAAPLRDWLARGTGVPRAGSVQSVNPELEPTEQAQVVNINTATEDELRGLPGVGNALVVRIIRGRPYRAVDGLLEVKGIGEKNLRAMTPFITIV